MDTAFARLRAPERALPDTSFDAAATRDGGLYDGTLIATVSGWRRVENLRPGDQVLTLDCGPVRLLAREELVGQGRVASPDLWPRLVPAGVLGNRAPMRLRAGQGVLLESPCAEAYCGDRFALLPVRALDGFGGIAPVPHPPQARVWRLHFAQSQVLCAEGEALVFCPTDPRLPLRKSALEALGGIAACGRAAVATVPEAPRYQPLSAAAAAGLLRELSCAAA